jgi:thymidylate synthase ThyX
MISAQIIADSISPEDKLFNTPAKRIITLQLRYPKFIHGEFMTHRVFSRNASSSRAIPFEKMVEDVECDMAMPVYWGSNKPGMQAGEEISEEDEAEDIWREAFYDASWRAQDLAKMGIHKQIVNRLIEPFCHINTLVTSTEWDNFFELRDHPDAQPEIRVLAQEMKKAIATSKPKQLYYGEWHLPYVQRMDMALYNIDVEKLIKISVARCARVSYLTHDQKEPNVEDDIKLYDRLVGAKPIHASPAEHQARPREISKDSYELCGNLKGWVQYRKLLEQDKNVDKSNK